MSNLREAIQKIRDVGTTNTRIVSTAGSNKVKIEINKNGSWVTIMRDIDKPIADDILRQASDRLLLG